MRTNSTPVPEAPTSSAAVYNFDLSHPLLFFPETLAYWRTWSTFDLPLFRLTAPKVPLPTDQGREFRITAVPLQTLNIPDEDALRNMTARLLHA